MSKLINKTASKRHNIPFDKIPTVKGNIHGGSVVYHGKENYSAILDCVYEMTDQVSNSNGISLEEAIETVIKDEEWRLLPSHKKLIIKKLKEN